MAKPDKNESRFDRKYSDGTVAEQLADGILSTFTGGLVPRGTTCTLIDKRTGEAHDGYGADTRSAREKAHSKFKK